jgi:dTDP-4-dehydrorhamnose 3,5-epimerase
VEVEALGVPDAWVCTPPVHTDSRGSFREWFRSDVLAAATGRRFRVVQANHSVSSRGVIRGIHYALVPPGQAKFVYCASGAVLDLVVDLRVGSPTFGSVDTVVLDPVGSRAVFLSEGLGHAFRALDDAVVVYLLSATHDPAREFAVSVADPLFEVLADGAPSQPLLSERDLASPWVTEARARGHLPDYDACLKRYAELALD